MHKGNTEDSLSHKPVSRFVCLLSKVKEVSKAFRKLPAVKTCQSFLPVTHSLTNGHWENPMGKLEVKINAPFICISKLSGSFISSH